MADLISTVMFYLFSGVMLASALMVISAKNPVHAVLFLILAFFNASGLFVLAGAEYLAMTLVIVYVGAVAVLFLFVVMMLDINFAELREGFLRYLPMGAVLAVVILAELLLVLYQSLSLPPAKVIAGPGAVDVSTMTNTRALGNLIYTQYVYAFQVSGLILLVAMIGAIVLTHRSRPGVRRQRVSKQVSRKRRDAVGIVQVKPGQGAGT